MNSGSRVVGGVLRTRVSRAIQRTAAISAAIAASLMSSGIARADGTWVPVDPNSYSWADPLNWTPAVPNAIGDVANLNTAINGDQTINLDGSKTVGTLNLGFTGAAITIATGSGGSLVFDNTASPALLNLDGGGANVISAPVTLTDPVTLTQNNTGSLNFTGVISGAGSLTRAGTGGVVTLTAANTYTSGTTVSGGVLRALVGGSMGTGALTMSGGTLQLVNDTGTNFGRNTTITADSTIMPDRVTSAATATTHTLGTLSIGNQRLTVTRGIGMTGAVIGGLTFGATTLTGNATLSVGTTTTVTLGAIGQSGGSQGLTIDGAAAVPGGAAAGAGTVVLTGAGTYSGTTNIMAGVVQMNNATAFGTATNVALDRNPSSFGTFPKRIVISGGLNTNYNFDIGLTGTLATVPGLSGTGLLSQTGTGQAKVNGIVTLGVAATVGGTFVGGAAVGNELVLNGAINSPAANVGFSQRSGRVIYAGGGSMTGLMSVTGNAIVAATNGIPVGVNPQLGGSGNAVLDLASQGAGGFDQRLAGVQFGTTAGAATNGNNVGSISLGARTLTLDGDMTSLTVAAGSATHTVDATPGGKVAFSIAAPKIVVPDSIPADDVVITGATLSSTGNITKTDTGSLTLRNVTSTVPLSITAGTIASSTTGNTGTLTAPGLDLASGVTARFNLAAVGGDVINGGVVTSGGTTVKVNQFGGLLASGTYPLINYTGTSPGLGNFTLSTLPGRLVGSLTDTGTAIALNVTANDTLKWTGNAGPVWDIGTTVSWKLNIAGTETTYLDGDDVTFDDTGTNTSISGSGTVAPAKVTFANTVNVPYSFSGFAIGGSASINKTGDGTVNFGTANTYAGSTTVAGGTLILGVPGVPGNGTFIGSGVAGNSINLSGGGRIQDTATAAFDYGVNRNIAVGAGGGSLSHNSATAAGVTISGNITGTGPLEFNSASTTAGTFILTGNNSGYTGAITVDADSTGLTALRIGNQNGAPGGGSITLKFPAAGATGNATTLDLPGTAVPASVTLNMTSQQNGGTSLRTQVTASGTAAINGPITVAGNAIVQFTPASGATLNINGNVTAGAGGFTGTLFVRGTGGIGFVNGTLNIPNGIFAKTDSGTWTVNSTGSVYTMAQVVSSGSVRLGATNALAIGATLSIGQGSDAAASLLEMNGFSQQVNGLTWLAGNANSARAVGNANATTQSTLTINTAGTFSYGSTTGITGGLITGNIRFVMAGSGTQTLNGADTYTGTTAVNGGRLLVTATHTGGASYTVNSGGSLGGTGSITLAAVATNQVLVQPGGVLNPGSATVATGILNVLNATPGTGAASTLALAGGTLQVDINGLTPGSQHDQVNVTGTVNVAGANLIALFGFAAADQDKFFVVNNDGTDTVNGTFATLNGSPLSGPDGNGIYTAANGMMLTLTGDSASGTLNGGNDIAVAVPEPAAMGLLGLAAVGLLSRRRRRAV